MEFNSSSNLNGILKYFYSSDQYYFYHKISVFASSTLNSNYLAISAFDFSNEKYWNGNENVYKNHFIVFCFTEGCAKITQYEMKTSKGGWRPSKWSLSGSNNLIKWEHNETESHDFSENEIKRFNWQHGPYKCFRLDCIKSTQESIVAFDIVQLELYGTYYSKCASILFTCKKQNARMSNSFLFSIICLLFK